MVIKNPKNKQEMRALAFFLSRHSITNHNTLSFLEYILFFFFWKISEPFASIAMASKKNVSKPPAQRSTTNKDKKPPKATHLYQVTIKTLEAENCYHLVRVSEPEVELVFKSQCPVCALLRGSLESLSKESKGKFTYTTTTYSPAKHDDADSEEPGHHALYCEGYRIDSDKLLRNCETLDKQQQLLRTRLKKLFNVKIWKEPLPHQKHLAENCKKILEGGSFLLYWSMGSGKTRGALQFLYECPEDEVFIVCSNTMIHQWKKQIQQGLQRPGTATVFYILGYQEFSARVYDDPNLVRDKFVVVDEAHRYRNYSKPMQEDMSGLFTAKFLLLLTGTPVVNDAQELIGMTALMNKQLYNTDKIKDKKNQRNPEDFKITPEQVRQAFKGKVSYYDAAKDPVDKRRLEFPKVIEHKIEVPLSWAQTFEHLTEVRDLSFAGYDLYNGKKNRYDSMTRSVCNGVKSADGKFISTKLDQIAKDVPKHIAEGKQVIYTHLIDLGVKPIKDAILKNAPSIKMAEITGKVSGAAREAAQDKFNSGRIELLILTDAGHEGLDLKGGHGITLTEPHQNLQSENQTINRVARYKSHSHLKPEERVVHVYKYISTFPSPSVPITKQDREHVRFYFEGKITDEEIDEIFRDVKDYLKKHPAYETIEQRLSKRNEYKHKHEVLPNLKLIQEQTIFHPPPSSQQLKQEEKEKKMKEREKKKREKEKERERKQKEKEKLKKLKAGQKRESTAVTTKSTTKSKSGATPNKKTKLTKVATKSKSSTEMKSALKKTKTTKATTSNKKKVSIIPTPIIGGTKRKREIESNETVPNPKKPRVSKTTGTKRKRSEGKDVGPKAKKVRV